MRFKSLLSSLRSCNRRRRKLGIRSTEVLEIRMLLTAEPFQQAALYASTELPLADARTTMQAGDWNDDGVSDMFLIQRSDTTSGKVEVSVYSTQYSYFDARTGGQPNYYTALLPVAMDTVNGDWEFRMDHWGGGSKPDLFAIHKSSTSSGFVEVTVFTGESNFTTSSSVFQTSLATAGRDWTFDVGHYDNDGLIDLFAVLRNGIVATELFVESGAGQTAFSTQLMHGNTAMPRTDKSYQFVAGDMGNDGVPDLLAIRKYGTDSGRVEVSILPDAISPDGADPFEWFSTRTATFIPDSSFDWDFDLMNFNSPFATPEDGVPDLVGFQKIAVSSPDFHFLSGIPSRPTAIFGHTAVPSSALFTSAAQTTSGLAGSYVNSSLRAVSSHADWRVTQAIVGARIDPNVSFTSNSLGARSAVSVTGGTDSNWDFFSVQWDGYVSIPSDGVRLRTSSSDGSRLWIDLNNDGQFGSSGNESINNNWGKGQDVTLGPASVQLAKRDYRIRIQFEEGTGPNSMQLLWDFAPTPLPVSAYFADAGKTTSGITGSYVNSSLGTDGIVPDWRSDSTIQISGTRVDSAIDFPRVSFGDRSEVGITSGSDADWDNFAVQWDGFIVIPADGVRLFTRSDDGSRFWVDVNGDGVFSDTAAEFVNNGFGGGQGATLSSPSAPLAAGTYGIRVQYEEGFIYNSVRLLWDYQPIQEAESVITSVAAPVDQRPVISWTPTTGAAGYEIWLNNLTTNAFVVERSMTPDTWHSTTQDLGIGRFAVWVRSFDINGVMSAWSPRYTFRVNSPVKLQPLASPQTNARPVISWDSIPGAVKYDVWINNLSTQEVRYVRQMDVTTNQWSPEADLEMGRYRVWVRAFDAAGGAAQWSKASDFVIATAPTPVSPLLPTFDRTPTLSWNALPGAAHFAVTIRNQNTSTVAYATTGLTGLSWTVPDDLPDGSHQWWVSGVTADGYKSAAPQRITFNVSGRPTVLSPVGTTSSTRPMFTWTAVLQASTYEIWVNRLDVATSRIIHISGLTSTEYTHPTALPIGTYRIWLRAVSIADQTGLWSAPTDVTIVGN